MPSAGWDAAAFYLLKGLSNAMGAVVGFFVISGFVLARSFEANPEAVRYFRNRAFRLFPAAVAVVSLLTALHRWFGIYVRFQPREFASKYADPNRYQRGYVVYESRMFRNAPDPFQRVACEARRRAVALGCHLGFVRPVVLGAIRSRLGRFY